MLKKTLLSQHAPTAFYVALSIVSIGILSIVPVSAAGGTVDCVNTGDPCLVKNEDDVKARNFCAAKADELLESVYDPSNGTADKEGVRMAISNSCFVGYTNGLNNTPPQEVAAICDGSTLTSAKERIKTDFPKICKDAYESAGGSSLAGVTGASSCDRAKEGGKRFLTMPAWYRGVLDSKCEVSADAVNGNISLFITIIVLNIVDILLNIVAYASIAFIMVGGFRMITSSGSATGMAAGRKTIINALIGLVISIASIGIVNLIIPN